ncbi:MAG: NAD(P)/FAD-dependent oxidoreductase [Pirellulales bacterium]|nr:NAD(P)/FAD-dependent oxidoreductase [Pirellulales bacterium]
MGDTDAVVIGSGPNGLAAAVALAQQGASVLVLERHDQVGGGTRSAELTLPGFIHDVCSAVHPMGILSPFFRQLPLDQQGLTWIRPAVSVAHPLDDEPAVILRRSVDDTARELGPDAASYRCLIEPLLRNPSGLLSDALAPLGIPRHPIVLLRFGWRGMRTANHLARQFEGTRARALFAGCAGHSILPFDRLPSAAIGLMFLLTGHCEDWPVAAGGSQSIADALASLLVSLGGRIETSRDVRSAADLPPAKVWLFDTDPHQLAALAHDVLPAGYVRRLQRYRYGPGVFKLDWALRRSIPWRDPQCLLASTVHLGGTYEEIAAGEAAVWQGQHPERPYVLVCQQSEFDPQRAPPGQHTGYAYCHVPPHSDVDMTEAIERQIERFAPGFRDCILARHVTTCADLERYNPNYVGGAIAGGAADVYQAFTRPVARMNPYTTPNPRVFICSASTPPGGGVHGMCGYHAAQAAMKKLARYRVSKLHS